MVKNVQFVRFKNSEVLFTQGSQKRQLFVLVSGKIVVELKNSFNEICELATFSKPLESFGEAAYLTHSNHSTTLRATEDATTVISFEIDENLDANVYCKAYAQLYKNLAISLAYRLRESNSHCFDERVKKREDETEL